MKPGKMWVVAFFYVVVVVCCYEFLKKRDVVPIMEECSFVERFPRAGTLSR